MSGRFIPLRGITAMIEMEMGEDNIRDFLRLNSPVS